MTTNPTVSVVIPTFNSAATIRRCLDSVRAQTYPPVETIVVDAASDDATPRIAGEYARVVSFDASATNARLHGAEAARGEYVLSLDSDQWLVPEALARCVAAGAPMVILGENSVGRGLVARANRADRAAVERHWAANTDPVQGPICPRFYARELFIDAVREIPASLRGARPATYAEDMIIFANAVRRGATAAYVPAAVYHVEMESLTQYARKWYRYGRNAKQLRGTAYARFATERGTRRLGGVDYFRTVPARVLKGVPYYLGYLL